MSAFPILYVCGTHYCLLLHSQLIERLDSVAIDVTSDPDRQILRYKFNASGQWAVFQQSAEQLPFRQPVSVISNFDTQTAATFRYLASEKKGSVALLLLHVHVTADSRFRKREK